MGPGATAGAVTVEREWEGTQPVAWDEDRTAFDSFMHIDADTYRPGRLFDSPPAPRPAASGYVFSPGGSFAYVNHLIPQTTWLRTDHRGRRGALWFSGDVVIPTLIDLTREGVTGEPFAPEAGRERRAVEGAVWMSLTPQEMITQRPGVRAARGTVVLGGLGLGWLLRKVCEKPSVERVVVVERSRELLDWYGSDLCRRHEKVTDVVCDDVYDQIGMHGPAARYVLDIWHAWGDAKSDPSYRSAKARLGRRLWGWGG